MRLSALTLFLIAVASLEIGLAQTAAQPRYSITISAANATVKGGSEIRVQIVQKNTTDRDQPFWIENIAKLHGEYLFLINVTRADGNKVHRSEYFRGVRDEAGNFMPGIGMSGGIIIEKPGDSFTSSIDLNELYELTPGKYAVQVYVNDSIAKVTVKSNTITVMVTP
jgi:hypothetical protein